MRFEISYKVYLFFFCDITSYVYCASSDYKAGDLLSDFRHRKGWAA
jgi:hypothetical protein